MLPWSLSGLLVRPGEEAAPPVVRDEQAMTESAPAPAFETLLKKKDDQPSPAASESVLEAVREAGKDVLEEAIEAVSPSTGEDVKAQGESASAETVESGEDRCGAGGRTASC